MTQKPDRGRHRHIRLPQKCLIFALGWVLGLPWILPSLHAQAILANPLPNLAGGALGLADMDGDGDQDVYLSGTDTTGNIVGGIYRSTTTGYTLLSTSPPPVIEGDMAWGDFDADGDPDLALAGLIPGQANPVTQIWQNNGVAGFALLPGNSMPLRGAVLAWADLDNDGDLDLIGSGTAPGSYGDGRIWRNDGGSVFSEHPAPWKGYAFGLAIADVNADNLPDILLITANPQIGSYHTLQLWRNTGALTFVKQTLPLQTAGKGRPCWADLDNSGTPDLLMPAFGPDNRTAILMNTTGNLAEVSHGLPNGGFSAIATGDYDADGDADIAIAGVDTAGQPFAQIYENTGTGVLLNPSPIMGVILPRILFKDMDGDGQIDLVISGFSTTGPQTTIYYNNLGTFQP